jgi:hypothetical protein
MNDITRLLAEWPFDPEQTVRMVFADDGRSLLQVRLPLGIEQYEMEGRPDGVCPFDTPTVLAEMERRLAVWVEEHGQAADFEISRDDFAKLQDEGHLFYFRYILLFQMNDFERVVRDTDHNLRMCELVEKHVRLPEDRNALLQYKPYIMRVNSVSRALMLLQQGRKGEAEEIVQTAIEKIRDLPVLESPTFQFERIRSINYLRSALKQVAENQVDPASELRRELQAAVEVENYERAAVLRDQLRKLSILDKQ